MGKPRERNEDGVSLSAGCCLMHRAFQYVTVRVLIGNVTSKMNEGEEKVRCEWLSS